MGQVTRSVALSHGPSSTSVAIFSSAVGLVPRYTSYLCAHGPAYHFRMTPSGWFCDPSSGALTCAASGGSGTNGSVSSTGPRLFHLRRKCSRDHSKNHGLVVKRLC